MLKIYKWSDLLDRAIKITPLYSSANLNSILEPISSYLEESMQENYYKYLNIIVVRSGSPLHNDVPASTKEVSPYYANNEELDNLINSSVDSYSGTIANIYNDIKDSCRLALNSEYKLWTKLKSIFADTDIKFVSIKNMFEGDIIRYLEKHSKVDIDKPSGEAFEHTWIKSINNSEENFNSYFYYTISELEKLSCP